MLTTYIGQNVYCCQLELGWMGTVCVTPVWPGLGLFPYRAILMPATHPQNLVLLLKPWCVLVCFYMDLNITKSWLTFFFVMYWGRLYTPDVHWIGFGHFIHQILTMKKNGMHKSKKERMLYHNITLHGPRWTVNNPMLINTWWLTRNAFC